MAALLAFFVSTAICNCLKHLIILGFVYWLGEKGFSVGLFAALQVGKLAKRCFYY